MSKSFWLSVGSSLPMKPSGSGASHSGKRMPMNCAAITLVVGTHGTWMRWCSPSKERSTPFGEQWIRMATYWICGSQSRRHKQAAKRFFRKLLRGLQYVPRVIIPDKLKSYGAAKREILPGVEHRQHKRLNNRAENSHQPTRLREKNMRKFKSAKQAQRFLSAFGPLAGHFQPRRHRLCARDYRAILHGRFLVCNEITGVNLVA
jgi:hypothetical protein